MHRRILALGSVFLLLCGWAGAQTYDAQSATVIAQSKLAVNPTQTVTDVVLTGTAAVFDGAATESGSATLKVKGLDESRFDVLLPSATRSEVRTAQSATPKGSWSRGSQTAQRSSLHNLLTPACWASPVALLSALLRPGATVSYVAQEQRLGAAVDHLRAWYVPPAVKMPDANTATVVRQLSTLDVYIDSASHLPQSLAFNLHADNDYNNSLPVEIRFASYTNVNGVMVPFHIQRLYRKSVNLDFTATSATLNNGLTDDQFSVQ